MDDPVKPEKLVFTLPLWIVMPRSGESIVGGDDADGASVAIFSDKDRAERYIRALGLTDCVPAGVPKPYTVAFLEMLQGSGFSRVTPDPSGAPGTPSLVLLLEDVLAAARRKLQGRGHGRGTTDAG